MYSVGKVAYPNVHSRLYWKIPTYLHKGRRRRACRDIQYATRDISCSLLAMTDLDLLRHISLFRVLVDERNTTFAHLNKLRY